MPSYNEETLLINNNNHTSFMLTSTSVITIIEAKPKGLIRTISEIGGLLILLKISIVLNILHEYFFERKLKA